MSNSDRVLLAVQYAVAAAVAYALTYLAKRYHVVLDAHTSALIQGAVLAVVAAAYQQVVSWVQRRWPAWVQRVPALKVLSWLVKIALGWDKQPSAMARPSEPQARLRPVAGR